MIRSRAAVHGDSRMRRGRIAAAARWRCGWRASMRPRGRRPSRPSSPPRRSPRRSCRTAATRIPRNIIDGEEPANSSDSSAYFDWWPVQGSKLEWVELTFAKPSTVSSSEIYWFDDTGRGGVRVPASWRLLYKSGERLAAGADDEHLRCRAQRLEHGRVHARHHGSASHRAVDAAGLLGGSAGVARQVITTSHGNTEALKHRSHSQCERI